MRGGETMKKINNTWSEKKMQCTECVNGKIKMMKRGVKFRVSAPCQVCMGLMVVVKSIPEFCEYGDCEHAPSHQCRGYICDDIWVCDAHWKQEDVGFSQNGYACETCFDEVGSGGH